MPEVTLSSEELDLLRRAAEAVLRQPEPGPHAAGAERALASLSRRPELEAPSSPDPRHRWALRSISSEEGHIGSLRAAVAEGRRVQFRYRSGETPADQTRRVEPFGLGYRNGGWYLAGHDVDRRDTRVYRVGRIAGEVKPTRKQGRTPAETPPLGELFRSTPWGFGPAHGPSVEARVLVDAERVEAVEKLLPERLPHRRLPDGQLLVRAFVHDAGLFFDWLLPLGAAAEVLSPSDLRSQMAVRLETTSIAWSRL